MPNLIHIYTDGACKGNPGPGGWGAILCIDGIETEIFGGESHTTNNRMELMAVIQALKTLQNPRQITVYTDSQYVQKGISLWLVNWKARGWRTADKKPVKNTDLWQTLDTLTQPHQISWRWVKAHAGDPLNERADQLANQGIVYAATPAETLLTR